jgi:hypothetical protein
MCEVWKLEAWRNERWSGRCLGFEDASVATARASVPPKPRDLLPMTRPPTNDNTRASRESCKRQPLGRRRSWLRLSKVGRWSKWVKGSKAVIPRGDICASKASNKETPVVNEQVGSDSAEYLFTSSGENGLYHISTFMQSKKVASG